MQARTLAIGRDERVATSISDSRSDAIFIDVSQYALNMRSALVWVKQLSGGRFSTGPTFGKSGDRTDQMIARMPQALATRARS